MDVVIISVAVVTIVVGLKLIFKVRNQNKRIKGTLDLCKGRENSFCDIREVLGTARNTIGILSISLFGKLGDPTKYDLYVKPALENARELMNPNCPLNRWKMRIYMAPTTAESFSP